MLYPETLIIGSFGYCLIGDDHGDAQKLLLLKIYVSNYI